MKMNIKLNADVFRLIIGYSEREMWPILIFIYRIWYKPLPRPILLSKALQMKNRFLIKQNLFQARGNCLREVIATKDHDLLKFTGRERISEFDFYLCATGDIEIIQTYTQINEENLYKCTLGICKSGNLSALDLLPHVDINKVYLAGVRYHNDEILQYAMKNGANIMEHNETFREACEFDNIKILEPLIAKVSQNCVKNCFTTVCGRKYNAVKILVHHVDDKGPGMFRACEVGIFENVKLLAPYIKSQLYLLTSDPEIIEFLIKFNLISNPIVNVCKSGNIASLSLIPNLDWNSVFNHACRYNQFEIIKMALPHISYDKQSFIFRLLSNDNIKILNYVKWDIHEIFHEACTNGRKKIIKKLCTDPRLNIEAAVYELYINGRSKLIKILIKKNVISKQQTLEIYEYIKKLNANMLKN
jgi:hypothetical protein